MLLHIQIRYRLAELVKSFKEVNPQMTNINQFQLLVKLGMPTDIAMLICRNSSANELDNPEDLGKFLKNQKTKSQAMNQIPDEEGVEESTVSSKTFLMENDFLYRKLNYFYKQNNTSLDRTLKESLLTSKKGKVLTENAK